MPKLPKIPTMAEVWKYLKESDVYKSMFRHGYADTPINRALAITTNVWLHLHPVKINRGAVRYRFTWGMGGISFLIFIMTIITGVVLMFYYRPVVEYAYKDIKYLDFDVAFGPLIRNMHRWAAHAMVIVVWLHMYRVFLTGSYKAPRQFNWGIGVVALLLTMFLSYTGYLLTYDQLAYWAVTVGFNMARASPGLGYLGPFGQEMGMTPENDMAFAMFGGTQVGPATLLRFYVLHCMFVPIILAALLIVHFWRVRKDGGISGPHVVPANTTPETPAK